MVNREAGQSSLRTSLSWFVASYGVAIVGYLGVSAIASRALGRGQFGYFVVAVTLTTIVGELCLVGTHRAGLREAARLRSDQQNVLGELHFRVRAACWVNLPVAAALTLAGLLLALGVGEASLAAAAAVLVFLTGHQKLTGNLLRGFGYLRFAGLLEGRSGGRWSVSLRRRAWPWWLCGDRV